MFRRSFIRINSSIYVLVVCLTAWVYFEGLNGGFLFDDTHVLEKNHYVKIVSLNWRSLVMAADSFVPGGRQLSMLSFALNHYFFGDSVWWYKAVNLFIHIFNGFGVLIFLLQISRHLNGPSNTIETESLNHKIRLYLPLAISAVWLLHPINLIPVLYISQRMALLSGFFVIYGLVFYVWARFAFDSIVRKCVYLPLGLAVFMVLGFKCKENAILLPVFAFIVEFCILKFKDSNNRTDSVVVKLFSVGLAMLVLIIAYKFWQDPNWINAGYKNRYYSLGERVLTQFRVLWLYLYQIILPSNSVLSLWHDDFTLSTGFLSPISTAFGLFGLIGLLGISLATLKKMPLVAFGILWYFVAHSLESSVFSLELVHEHRNYLASVGILAALLAFVTSSIRSKNILSVFLVIFALNIIYILHARVQIWSNEFVHAQHEANSHPLSPAATFHLGGLYRLKAIGGDNSAKTESLRWLNIASNNDERNISPEIMLVILSELENIDYDPSWLDRSAEKLTKYPYMASSKGAIQGLYQCIKDRNCDPPTEDVEKLFDAAYSTKNRNLLTSAAFYYTEINIDLARAEKAFRRARSNRLASTWVNYLSFLLYVKKHEVACKEYVKFINRLEKNSFRDATLLLGRIAYIKSELSVCK